MKTKEFVIDPFLMRGSIDFAKLTPHAAKMLLWVICETVTVAEDEEMHPDVNSLRFWRFNDEDMDAFDDGIEQLVGLGLVVRHSTVEPGDVEFLAPVWEQLAEMGITRR